MSPCSLSSRHAYCWQCSERERSFPFTIHQTNCCCGAQVSLEQAQAHGPSHMLPATYANPLGRASISRPTAAQFERASVVRTGLRDALFLCEEFLCGAVLSALRSSRLLGVGIVLSSAVPMAQVRIAAVSTLLRGRPLMHVGVSHTGVLHV